MQRKVVNIEVKGTQAKHIAWNQLKISGDASKNGIVDGWPVYRVFGVFERTPRIYILRHNDDFTLKREVRWTFKRIKHK